MRFTTASEFLTPIAAVISRYYGNNIGDKTRMNQAMSYHMKEALVYNDPVFDIAFNKVQISKGDLLGIQNPIVTATGSNNLKYEWEDNSGQGAAKPTDVLVLVVYEPISGQYYYLLNAATRATATATITLPIFLTGLTVQNWITFVAADEKSYATSVYMGSLAVT